MANILFQIGVVYFLGHLFAFVFKRFKMPDILLFTVIGLIIGPILKVSLPEHFGQLGPVLSTLALIIILFESGTTLNFKKLVDTSGLSVAITLLTMIATVLVITLVTWPFLRSFETCLLIGVIAGGTSSAVVIPMVNALGMSDKLKNVLITESALTDVLCITLTLTVAQSVLLGTFDTASFFGKIISSLAVAALMGAITGLVWSKFRHLISAHFATIAVALILYGIAETLGFSGPIAVMSFGVMLAQAPGVLKNGKLQALTEFESNFYSELVFVFKVFFFIYLGISINIKNLYLILIAVFLLLFILALRFLFVRTIAGKAGTVQDLTYTGLLVPKGLAAAVLAGVPMQMGVPMGDSIQEYVYTIVLVSIVMVSILIPLSQMSFARNFLNKFFPNANA